MTVKIIVFMAFLCITVSECRKHRDSKELTDALRKLQDKNKRKTTTPLPTIPPPLWKPSGNSPSNLGMNPDFGYNPAGYGPQPLHYYTNSGASIPHPPYTINDTGDTALGFFLKNSLAKISTPTYYYYNANYDRYGYLPKYDHYTIHHYYHNGGSVGREVTIHPDTIVVCRGDSSVLCPANTTSLCTNNGALLCVASVSTKPCGGQDCVPSSVPCRDNYSTQCSKSFSRSDVPIIIPCVSTAKVFGSVSYIQDSVIVSNNYAADNPLQRFCVAVLAIPAERKTSEGDKLLRGAHDVFFAFAIRALGIDKKH